MKQPELISREQFLSDRHGKTFADVLDDPGTPFDEVLEFFNDAERQAIYQRIYTIVRDDAPWIFLYSPTRYFGVSSTMTDWQPRADGLLIFPWAHREPTRRSREKGMTADRP